MEKTFWLSDWFQDLFFQKCEKLLENGSSPYFYLPKLEHYKEARWWEWDLQFLTKLFRYFSGTY